jgi:RNA polymerase sigma-70 factor (ECF subfamily)
MVTREPVDPTLSRDEIEEAIRSLPPAGWIKLRKAANTFCRRGALDPDDLLQEAFARAIDGSRRCPRNVDIVRFLAQTMRSIATDTLEVARRQPEFRAVPLIGDDGVPLEVPARELSAEERLIELRETKRLSTAIIDLFADDPIAEVIVIGIMEGMDGEELRALTELDDTDFASKRRLIRRRIDAAFPHGEKP